MDSDLNLLDGQVKFLGEIHPEGCLEQSRKWLLIKFFIYYPVKKGEFIITPRIT